MAKLVIRLLGGFRVELDGEVVYGFESDKGRALLAYLVVESERPHRRETLASLLWPDRPDAVARTNLRQALSRVRRALREADREGPPFLFVTPQDVQFNTATEYTLDVAALESFARSPRGAAGHRRELLPRAYCADFLAGFSVPNSETFEAWVLSKQEYYHQLALEILEEQNAYFEGIGDYKQAVEAARLQLQLEPWLEEAHRRCMRGLALAGRQDEALRQYEACRQALDAEVGLEPAASTETLCADIRAGRLVAPARPWQPAQPTSRPEPAKLVARGDQLGQLGQHLEAALTGEPGVAFVSGEPGSGKTMLLEAFAATAMASHGDLLLVAARCSPGGSLDPFAPLRKLAETLFGDPATGVGWRPTRDQRDRLQRATELALGSLAEHGLGLVDTLIPAPSIARRAGFGSEKAVSGRTAAWRAALESRPKPAAPLPQGVLLDQLICTLAAIAWARPLLLVFDDLQWVDDATAAFISRAGREISESRLLILGAYRSTSVAMGRRDPTSGEATRHPIVAVVNDLRQLKGEIVVDLDRADGRAFVEAYVDTESNRLGALFRDALYAQTGGHALFTVESLRNLQERGELTKDEAGRWVAQASLDWGALPARVEATIAQRIDRLPEAQRRILSCASVQGDSFAGELVAELAGESTDAVLESLSDSLTRQHQLVFPQGWQPLGGGQQSLYRFTHHLFQKYLYDQLDPVERARMHGATAAALDRQVGDDPVERERLSVRLAWHFEEGNMPLQAARALHDAGCEAMRLSASREALDRFDHGLRLLAQAPPSPERAHIQRLLEVARLGAQRNLSGPGSAGMAGTLAQAAEAQGSDAEARPKLIVLSAKAEGLYARGQTDESNAVAQQMLELAALAGDDTFVALAHWRLGANHTITFDLHDAESHLGWTLDWLTPERSAEVQRVIGLDLAGAALSYSAINRWFLGYPETGLARGRQAVAGAIERGAVYGQAFTAAMGADLMFLLRDETAMVEQAEMCHRLSTQHEFGLWRVYAEVFLGRVMVLRGEYAAGVERMRGGVGGWKGAGMVPGTATLVLVFADTCLRGAGQAPRGKDSVDAAHTGLLATGLAMADSILDPSQAWKDYGYLAELHRVRGELLLARDGLAASREAMRSFGTAIRLAREHDLLSPELRAAMSLVRLHERQGAAFVAELAEARECLAAAYGRFMEGFDFPDLQDAVALIGNHPRQGIGETR